MYDVCDKQDLSTRFIVPGTVFVSCDTFIVVALLAGTLETFIHHCSYSLVHTLVKQHNYRLPRWNAGAHCHCIGLRAATRKPS